MCKIRLVIHHINSRTDTNGNRYWMAKLTATHSGESYLVNAESDSNTVSSARQHLNWGEFIESKEELPKREFTRRQKHYAELGYYSLDDMADLIGRMLK